MGLAHTQIKRRPSPTFMESMQHDINPTMRGILVDWLVEVKLLLLCVAFFVYTHGRILFDQL